MKKPSDERLRTKMNNYAVALLDAWYGGLLPRPHEKDEDGNDLPKVWDADNLPKADVFNAVVNWLRTDSGMEPATQEKSGIANLTEQLGKRKR